MTSFLPQVWQWVWLQQPCLWSNGPHGLQGVDATFLTALITTAWRAMLSCLRPIFFFIWKCPVLFVWGRLRILILSVCSNVWQNKVLCCEVPFSFFLCLILGAALKFEMHKALGKMGREQLCASLQGSTKCLPSYQTVMLVKIILTCPSWFGSGNSLN